MASLFSAQTSNATGSGASHSGPCTVFIRGTMDGADVTIEAADEDVAGSYVGIDKVATRTAVGCFAVDGRGTYYLRAKLNRAGTSTSVTVVTTQ